jgi:hypothetical protein
MSRQELVDAYLEGSVSRRSFVRRLVASGVTAGAAVSYAQLLAPEAEAARPRKRSISDHYPLMNVKLVSSDLADVLSKKKLKVKVSSSESAHVHIAAFAKQGGDLAYLGSGPGGFDVTAGGAKTVPIKIARLGPLQGEKSVQIYLDASATHKGFVGISAIGHGTLK